MSSKTDIKIRKLRKAHIWPSLILTLCSMVLAILTFFVILSLIMSELTDNRIYSAVADCSSVSMAFLDDAGDEQEVIDTLLANDRLQDAFCITDQNNELLAGYGDFDLNSILSCKPAEDLEGATYRIRGDISYDGNLITKEGNVKVIDLTDRKLWQNFLVHAQEDEQTTAIYTARFWVEDTLPGGRTAFTRGEASIYTIDFAMALGYGVFGLGVMLLPTLFLFVNVLFNVFQQRRMTKLLYTSTITGGNNAVCFEHNAARMLQARRYTYRQFLVVDLTLMKYRSYCNYHGVHAGEALLEQVDRSLKAKLKRHELCALAAKSSFALLLFCDHPVNGQKRVEQLVQELTREFSHGGIVFHAGIYFTDSIRSRQRPANALSDPADMYNCAGAARGTLTDENAPAAALYAEDLMEQQRWAHKVEERMNDALYNEEFQVYIQPKYNPVTEQLAGAEALVRWINEEDGFISPGKFIPIFEKNGFITKLDDYMLSHVAALQAGWLAEGRQVVPISVNVSRAHFANPGLAQHICRLVDQYQVPHHLIEIELTESAFFDDKAMLLRTVHELGSLGFEISMDDFGAGYSSLNSLKDLPLDVLKLDADFFRGENAMERGEIVVSQAITLAKKLDMRIVAEGVEKKEQVDFLAEQGCDMIQGFYYAKPMPAAEYALRLQPGTQTPSPAEEQVQPVMAVAEQQ